MSARTTAFRLLLPIGLGSMLLSGLLLLSRCFNPQLPACSFICNSSDGGGPACPAEYECRSDGYCHLRGSTESCPYSMDLSPAPDLWSNADMSVPSDMTAASDMTTAASDMTTAASDMTTAASDMSSATDM